MHVNVLLQKLNLSCFVSLWKSNKSNYVYYTKSSLPVVKLTQILITHVLSGVKTDLLALKRKNAHGHFVNLTENNTTISVNNVNISDLT